MFYNSGLMDEFDESINDRYMSIWTLIDYIEQNGYVAISLIGMAYEK